MKIMRKLLVLLLATMLIVTALSSVAFAEPASTFVQSKNYISVSGTAAGSADISVILKKVGESISEESVLYIGQTTADKNGEYALDFTVSGSSFTVEDGYVTNYEIVINADGIVSTDTIVAKARISEIVTFDIDMSTKGKAKAVFQSDTKYKNLDYVAFVAYYDAKKQLLGVVDAKGYIGDDGVFNYDANNIPNGTETIKGFIWESSESMIPITAAQEAIFDDENYDRAADYVTIAPGRNESERNFAWYDISGITGVRVQYAEKVSGTASDFDDDNIFTGTCGSTAEIKQWNGTAIGNTVFAYGHDYTWAKATITGLEKGKTYVYRLGDDEGWLSGIYEFTTDAAPENGFKTLLFSDEHVRPSMSQVLQTLNDVRDKAFEVAPDASLVIATGDQLDYPWEEIGYQAYYDRTNMTSVPMATVPGTTHDIIYENTRTDFEVALYGFHSNMPNAHETSGKLTNVGSNYWYTYGDVLFIGINYNGWSIDDPAVQSEFIKNAVAQADAEAAARGSEIKWRVLYSHYPFGFASSEDKIEKYYGGNDDFIADNGIDVVFHGHEHAYWRTYQVYSGEKAAGQATQNADRSWTITDPGTSTVHFSLNTSGLLGGVVTDDRQYSKIQPYIAYTDEGAIYGLASDYRGKSYTANFSVLDIKTVDNECTLTVNTYRNTFEGAESGAASTETKTVTLTKTELIDSYTIVKTN